MGSTIKQTSVCFFVYKYYMRIKEIITELRKNPDINVKIPVSQQIKQIMAKHGGTADDYFISFSDIDHLGFYRGTDKVRVMPSEPLQGQLKYNRWYRGTGKFAGAYDTAREKQKLKNVEQKYAIWFTPLKYVMNKLINNSSPSQLPYGREYLFLVKLNSDAWLQPVELIGRLKANLVGIKPPQGKRLVGQISDTQAMMWDPTAYKVVGKWTLKELRNNYREFGKRDELYYKLHPYSTASNLGLGIKDFI